VAVKTNDDRKGLAWQVSVWDRISQIYLREVDKRFALPPTFTGNSV
jgi:hypothetical protein